MQKLSFKPPQLSEEEERSPLIPDLMRCDGCLAVAHQEHCIKPFVAAATGGYVGNRHKLPVWNDAKITYSPRCASQLIATDEEIHNLTDLAAFLREKSRPL